MSVSFQKSALAHKSPRTKDGTFIAIEGTDGSGKGTQFELLRKRLEAAGHEVAAFDFPQYDQPSSYFVRQYLNGAYGSGDEVEPYTASLFYALDRYEATKAIRQALDAGKIVLANRYVGSNMAHQGTKFRHAEQRRGYFIWVDNLEFEMLGVPRPTISMVLRVPADIAQKLVDQKGARSYTAKKRDIHEADLGHLEKSVEVYDDLCQLFPKDFTRLDCVRGGELLSIEDVQNLLWEKVQPLLPKPPRRHGAKTEAKPEPAPPNPYVEKTEGRTSITPAGYDYLSDAVTDTRGNVYAFTDKLSPVTIAAAMARLSRRGDDMRITILDEFANAIHKDEQLLQRVITAYGDDSVQQLAGLHVVVENASNLLTKKLEWGRLAAYLEQSTRYIYFDQKDADGNFKYLVPENLDDKTTELYRACLDKIFELYSTMARQLTTHVGDRSTVPESERDGAWRQAVRAQACDAIRPVLPVATKSTVGIFASGQALESLIMHLLSDELGEARTTGQALLEQARRVMPTFLERADKPERGGAMVAYRANTYRDMKTLAEQSLPSHFGASTEPVELTDIWPRNELDLVPDMLYEHSNLSLKELRNDIAQWPYDKKAFAFRSYMGERLNRRHRPGRALEKTHYSFDILCDYGIFRDLQRHRMVDDLEWQSLTPRYGYDVPKLVEEAGLEELFNKCFELSLKLYDLLQKSGYALEAQYATLLGHKMRWKITLNAREAFHFMELRTSPQGHPGYRKLAGQMYDKIAEAHPLTAAAMRFVNQDEDPELTRLAAERYTQYKLQKLSKHVDTQESAQP